MDEVVIGGSAGGSPVPFCSWAAAMSPRIDRELPPPSSCKWNGATQTSDRALPVSITMFSKTWRVHAIFTDIKLNKKASDDH
ncbi:Gamma-aminobutyric acid type B receptor subunit 2 [Tyrophagus putrescentiae]|nr:Gamma-aminobutyric acid type B receptor subunit 2 [Tyrophagus putrescentiae]